jgi:hypothetical protein
MARTPYRSAYGIRLLVVLAPAFLAEGVALADVPPEPEARGTMQCDRASEPGRVRCTVEVRVEGGRTLAWADVAILSLPDFASALKGRIGAEDTLSRDGASTKWALGLVARRAGQGEVRARVRAVVCLPQPEGGGQRCSPVAIDVKAVVTVG